MKTDDGEVRKPPALLGLVDPESRQPPVNVLRNPRRMPVVVVEDEHADGARLSVPNRGEQGPSRALGPCTQRSGDRGDLIGRPRAQKRDRDVQVLFGNEASLFRRAELFLLPAGDSACGRGRQAKAEKEP